RPSSNVARTGGFGTKAFPATGTARASGRPPVPLPSCVLQWFGRAKRSGELAQGSVRQNKGVGQDFRIVVDQVGKAYLRQNLDGEDFLNSLLEFQKSNRPGRGKVHDPNGLAASGSWTLLLQARRLK